MQSPLVTGPPPQHSSLNSKCKPSDLDLESESVCLGRPVWASLLCSTCALETDLQTHSGLTGGEQACPIAQVTPIHNQPANGTLINEFDDRDSVFMEH